eukprot:6107901-Karenia_brevis.AAC.1
MTVGVSWRCHGNRRRPSYSQQNWCERSPVRFRSDSFADRVFRVFRGLALNAKVFTFAECLIRIYAWLISIVPATPPSKEGFSRVQPVSRCETEQVSRADTCVVLLHTDLE